MIPATALTPTDYDIVTYGARAQLTHEYAQLAHRLDRMSETQDRRDAEVMLIAVSHRQCFWTWLRPNGPENGILLRWRGPAPIVVKTFTDGLP